MATILEINSVTKKFGGLTALQDINMKIEQGEILGLIGPNGSGKTTLVNVITGFLRPTTGSIMYKGESIGGTKPHEIAKRGINRTFQLISVFPDMTVEENIIAGRHLKTSSSIWGSFFHTRDYRKEQSNLKGKANEILRFTGLQQRRDVLAKNLSLGEQKSLEVAGVLATEPDLLLLDEPVAGMTLEEATNLMDLIRAIQEGGTTVMVIEHNMKVVMRLCTRIAVLDFGVKIAEGTPQEIIDNPAVISAYLGKGRRC